MMRQNNISGRGCCLNCIFFLPKYGKRGVNHYTEFVMNDRLEGAGVVVGR